MYDCFAASMEVCATTERTVPTTGPACAQDHKSLPRQHQKQQGLLVVSPQPDQRGHISQSASNLAATKLQDITTKRNRTHDYCNPVDNLAMLKCCTMVPALIHIN
jgi:hypothetical protein